jgi:MOSC domain-containing protein YiiM
MATPSVGLSLPTPKGGGFSAHTRLGDMLRLGFVTVVDMPTLISVNVGQAQAIVDGGKSGSTGIFKNPTTAPVAVTTLGLDGDHIADTKHHGGVDQAVYVYSREDYDWWMTELQTDFIPGTFGDNLTIANFPTQGLFIGDRLIFKQVVLEITAPRIPCSTLAARMNDSGFVKRFHAAKRPGVYCRVIQIGHIQVGEDIIYQQHQGERVSVLEIMMDFLEQTDDIATLERYLAAPVAIRERDWLQQRLGRAQNTTQGKA